MMNTTEIVQCIKEAKQQKKLTLNEIASESGVAIRTVNRIFAGEDVRFSSLRAVLEALDLSTLPKHRISVCTSSLNFYLSVTRPSSVTLKNSKNKKR